jgi:NAD(P)-dependent dehydrogenase (short-subunit alcohol dehydrogenase family)
LINNAGVGERPAPRLGEIDAERWLAMLQVNTIAPVIVAAAFLAHVEASQKKHVVAITSRMGSIGANTSGGSYAYRSTKSALNMAYKTLSLELQPRGITVSLFHPGHVRTDMGSSAAPLSPEESVAGMRRVIAKIDRAETGRYWNYDGAEIPW